MRAMPNRTTKKAAKLTLAPRAAKSTGATVPPTVPQSPGLGGFPALDAEAIRAPLQYVNAVRALPTPDGLVLYCFAASPDARNTLSMASAPVAKLLIPTGFVRQVLDVLGEQAADMGLLADLAEEAPAPAATTAVEPSPANPVRG
jgi:hypothetical protein